MCAMRGRGFVNNSLKFSPRGAPWGGHSPHNYGNRPPQRYGPPDGMNFRGRSPQAGVFGHGNGNRPPLSPSHSHQQTNFHFNSPPCPFPPNLQRPPFVQPPVPFCQPNQSPQRFRGTWGNSKKRGQSHQGFQNSSPHDQVQMKRKQMQQDTPEVTIAGFYVHELGTPITFSGAVNL